MKPKTPDLHLAGQVRKHIASVGGKWKIDPTLADDAPLPLRMTGATQPTQLASEVPRINFDEIKKKLDEAEFRSLMQASAMPIPPARPKPLPPPSPGAPPSSSHPKPANPEPSTIYSAVDWRDRWGYPWLTKVRDQNPCGVCWAFAATALVETMMRIEHCVWAPRSEGDALLSANSNCNTGGNVEKALQAIQASGLADDESTPFVAALTNYMTAADRPGRIARIASFTPVGHIDDQKRWLLEVGPLATGFYVWRDFAYGYGHGSLVYHVDQSQIGYVDATHPGDEIGWHALLIVGFNDALGAWIVRNSWGPGWGYQGYGYVGYGETEIDTHAKYGVMLTDCDPWAKRRLHNGCLLEGDQGERHSNLEIVAAHPAPELQHWVRENGSWNKRASFAQGIGAASAPSLIQSTFTRNHELVYRNEPGGRLHHWWRGSISKQWKDGGTFGPADATGVPGLIQSTYGVPGNLEVVTRTQDGQLVHMTRREGQWVENTRFGSNVKHSGPSLVQSSFGKTGDFELVCVLENGRMQHWHRANSALILAAAGVHERVWSIVDTFGGEIDGVPCMIEGQAGAQDEDQPGNFELCVAVAGQFQHWWRNNNDLTWHFGGSYGHNIAAVLGLCQSSSGFNLELVVQLNDGRLQHYWRQGSVWSPGPIIF